MRGGERISPQHGRNHLGEGAGAALSGAAAGLSAAFVMNCFQMLWGKASDTISGSDKEQDDPGQPATVKAVDTLERTATGKSPSQDGLQVAGNLLHYGFGVLIGAAYGMASSSSPNMRAGNGTLYGGLVWLVADEALVPAAGLSPPATQVSASTHIYALVSHLVFGAALDASLRVIRGGRSPA